MKNLITYINEHFVNALSKKDMKKHIDEVWDILVRGYELILRKEDLQNLEIEVI